MLWFVIVLFLIGLIAGAIARLVVPGRDPMGILGTALLGIGGSFIGGFIGYLIHGGRVSGQSAIQPSGIIGSIVGAVILLLTIRAFNRRRAVTR